MEYTAVTTIYNDKDEILGLINNLESQIMPPCEIIIVDGGSNSDTINVVNEYIPKSKVQIKFIVEGKKNISQGFNTGIRLTNTDFVAIVAVGNFYNDDYFYQLSKKIEEGNLDYSYSPFWGQDNGKFSNLYNIVFLNKNRGMRLPIASNHGVLIKRTIFQELGYFYEYFIYAGEDLEFYWKVLQSGYKGKSVGEAKVFWDTPHNWKAYVRQVKAYAVARMQIYTLPEILKTEKMKFIYVIGILGNLVCMFFRMTRYSGAIAITVCIILNLIKCEKNGLKYVFLKNANIFLVVFNYIIQYKYLKREYKVNDSNRLRD